MSKSAMNLVYRRRLWMHRFGIFLSFCAMAVGILFLAWILVTLIIKGAGGLSFSLFTLSTPAPGSEGGGLANAIVGSLLMVGLSTLIGTPIGVMAGIYLGGNRYHLFFASIADFQDTEPAQREVAIQQAQKRYVALLEAKCVETPWNWFNFYDFWASETP